MTIAAKRRPLLICLVGMDGTGKTTLAMNLVERLNLQGIKTRYAWNGSEPRIMRPFMMLGKRLFLRHENRASDYGHFSVKLKKSLSSPFLGVIYEFVLLLDYWIQILVNTRIPLLLKKTIVSDRYFYDVLINLSIDLSYSDRKIAFMRKAFLKMCPRPDLIFLVDLAEETAYQRKGDTPSVGYLTERRQSYLNMGRQYGMILLDGAKDLAELHSEIWNKLKEIL